MTTIRVCLGREQKLRRLWRALLVSRYIRLSPPDLYKLLFINLLININSVYLFMRDFICSRVGRGAGTNLLK